MSHTSPKGEIAIFGSSTLDPGGEGWHMARRCGRLVAEAGYTVTTGGYGGAMEAVSQGAREAGGHVIGVTAPSLFPGRSGANRYVIEEHVAASLTERIHRLLDPAVGVIALPGSLGTFTELVTAWNIAYIAPLREIVPPPIAAVGATWRSLVPHIAATLGTGPSPLGLFEGVDEAVAHVTRTT